MVQENLKVKILKVKEIAKYAKSFVIERPEKFDYKAGQHAFIETKMDFGKPFSLVSSPTEDFLEFATLIRDKSEFKQELNSRKEGNELILSGPYGQFQYEDDEKDIGFIAGGIGITPFMGILRYLTAKGMGTKVALLYSNKSSAQTAFKDELDMLADKNRNIKIVYTMTEEPSYPGNKGRIDREFIEKNADAINEKVWYIAGPPKMVIAMNGILKEFNVERVKLDSFAGY